MSDATEPKPEPVTINLDGDIDFSQPVPEELATMLREGAAAGPVTIWSSHLAETDYSSKLWNWLLQADSAAHPLSMQLATPSEEPPEGATAFTPPAPPPPEEPAPESAPTPPPPVDTGATGATGV